MAKTEKRDHERTGSSSYFLRCFGFPRKIYLEKPKVATLDGGEKRNKKWFSCFKFRMKKKGEINPIEETEKPSSRVKGDTDKQIPLPVIRPITDRIIIPADDKETKETNSKVKTPDRSTKPIEPLVCSREYINNSTRYVKTDPKVRWVNPVIGISVIIVTLVIMLIWGRLCAILCTAAWCYFLPRLTRAVAFAKRNRSGSPCDRKVALGEFLGRRNRIS